MIAIPMLEMRPPGSQHANHLPRDIKLVNVEAKCKLRLMRFPVPPARLCHTAGGQQCPFTPPPEGRAAGRCRAPQDTPPGRWQGICTKKCSGPWAGGRFPPASVTEQSQVTAA